MRVRAFGGILLALAAVIAVIAIARDGHEPARGATSGSTIESTWADLDGDGVLRRGPGERMRDRTELAPASRPGRTLVTFAQITDAHVRDEESPARATLLDRLGGAFTSTFRPQEALTTQALAAAVRSVNAARPQAVLVTGDLTDNGQANEMAMATEVLSGGRVGPDSGARGYDGPQSAAGADPYYYRPDVDAPRYPGLLDRAQRPFRSPGLRAPWYPVLGNHDAQVQGEVPPTPRLRALATGGRVPDELDPDFQVPGDARELTPQLVDRGLDTAFAGRTRAVPADPGRRLLDSAQAVDRLRGASGRGGSGSQLDYVFDIGSSLRVIVLDVQPRGGGSGATISDAQLARLGTRLGQAGTRRVIVTAHQPLPQRALAVLDDSPSVLGVITGHTHRNRIRARRTGRGGYWLVSTASLTDYPQQARAFRLARTTNGGVALETWMLDTAPGRLADTSRQLGYLDAQGGRPDGLAGRPSDRNARLFSR